MTSMWAFDDAMGHAPLDLAGFDVEATDGPIGTIDETSNRVDAAHVVVVTGASLFGKKRLIPAGLVRLVNENARTVHVSLSLDQIKSAPDFHDQDRYAPDPAYDAYYRSLCS